MNTQTTNYNSAQNPQGETSEEYDYRFKVVLVGDSAVGKSCLLLRFADDTFNESYISTIGVDFRFKTILLNNKSIKLQLWDTAGQEKFRCITNAYYKGAEGIVLVYDTTNRESFENLESWTEQIKDFADIDPLVMLLGNKCDVDEEREVSVEEAKKFSESNNMKFHEVSAKTNENIGFAFKEFSESLIEHSMKKKGDRKETNDTSQDRVSTNRVPRASLNNKLSQKIKKNVQSNCCYDT